MRLHDVLSALSCRFGSDLIIGEGLHGASLCQLQLISIPGGGVEAWKAYFKSVALEAVRQMEGRIAVRGSDGTCI